MNWEKLTDIAQLETIKTESAANPVLIFKHSTRCSISATAMARLERNWKSENPKGLKTYYLDLIAYRPVSAKIEADFHIEHQSPQVLLIKNGKCVYDASHMAISMDEIVSHA
jgi:bacillithiol system protein YtxJ